VKCYGRIDSQPVILVLKIKAKSVLISVYLATVNLGVGGSNTLDLNFTKDNRVTKTIPQGLILRTCYLRLCTLTPLVNLQDLLICAILFSI